MVGSAQVPQLYDAIFCPDHEGPGLAPTRTSQLPSILLGVRIIAESWAHQGAGGASRVKEKGEIRGRKVMVMFLVGVTW